MRWLVIWDSGSYEIWIIVLEELSHLLGFFSILSGWWCRRKYFHQKGVRHIRSHRIGRNLEASTGRIGCKCSRHVWKQPKLTAVFQGPFSDPHDFHRQRQLSIGLVVCKRRSLDKKNGGWQSSWKKKYYAFLAVLSLQTSFFFLNPRWFSLSTIVNTCMTQTSSWRRRDLRTFK